MLLGMGNALPKFNSATEDKYNATPSDATTLPSGAAFRSGLKTRKCTANPSTAATTSAKMIEGTIGHEPSLARVMRTGMLTSWLGRKSRQGK